MIDWHCHMLPGIDDGPETMVESLAMGRMLAAAGFRVVHCTPHCMSGRYDTGPDQVRELTERMQRNLLAAGIPLLVKPGMEYYLDENFPEKLIDPLALGESRLLLVEIPGKAGVEVILENVYLILQRGLKPLFAHPERSPLLNESLPAKNNGVLRSRIGKLFGRRLPATRGEQMSCHDLRLTLQEAGCLFQGNLGSFAGWYGAAVRQAAQRFLENDLYSRLGSDGHGCRFLEGNLLPGLSLVREHPRGNILLDSPLPSGVTLQTQEPVNW
ncbi:MAG: CpsB/CapC family capsule biosynthesis tyrosine phosphatase [Syntrophotaleaceae bacterium]